MTIEKYEASGFIPAAPDDQRILGLPTELAENWPDKAADFVTSHPDWPLVRDLLKSCSHCGQCAEACPLWLEARHDDYWPRRQAALLTGRDGPITLKRWLKTFGACSFCGRCSAQCPQGLKPQESGRLGLAFLVSVGLGPEGLVREAANFLRSGNLKNRPAATWNDAAVYLSREYREEGLEITIGWPRRDYLVVAPMSDLIERPAAILGYARFFKALNRTWSLAPGEPLGLSRFLPPRLGEELLSGHFTFWKSLAPQTLLWGETPADWDLISQHPELRELKPRHILDEAAEHLAGLAWKPLKEPFRLAYYWGCRLSSLPGGRLLGEKAESILAAAGGRLYFHRNFRAPQAYCCGRGPYEPGSLEIEIKQRQSRALLNSFWTGGLEFVATSCPQCRERLSAALKDPERPQVKAVSVFELLNRRLA